MYKFDQEMASNNVQIEYEKSEQQVWAGIESYAFVCDDKARDEVIFDLTLLLDNLYVSENDKQSKIVLLTIDILKIMSDKEFNKNCQRYLIRRSQGEINSEYLNGTS
jgi:hypothetical protein